MSVIELAPIEKIDLKAEVVAPSADSSAVVPLLDDHAGEGCEVITSAYAGNTFDEYLKAAGRKVLGKKAQSRKLPFLIKKRTFTEEAAPIIHGDPDRLKMFYIVDAPDQAGIWYGLAQEMSREAFRSAMQSGNILENMAKAEVRAGQVYVIEAGTIYAVDKGITVIEVEQDGKSAGLDEDQLLDSVRLVPIEADHEFEPSVKDGQAETTLLASCDAFDCFLTTCHGAVRLPEDDDSFASLVFVSGTAVINDRDKTLHASELDSFFVEAGSRDVEIVGNAAYLYTVC